MAFPQNNSLKKKKGKSIIWPQNSRARLGAVLASLSTQTTTITAAANFLNCSDQIIPDGRFM